MSTKAPFFLLHKIIHSGVFQSRYNYKDFARLFASDDIKPTSNPGPFGIEAAREKALVKSGHVTPQILDIFVTWPYYGYASTGGELIEVTEYFLNYLSKYIARDTSQDRKINVFMSFFYFRWDHVL